MHPEESINLFVTVWQSPTSYIQTALLVHVELVITRGGCDPHCPSVLAEKRDHHFSPLFRPDAMMKSTFNVVSDHCLSLQGSDLDLLRRHSTCDTPRCDYRVVRRRRGEKHRAHSVRHNAPPLDATVPPHKRLLRSLHDKSLPSVLLKFSAQ